MKIAKNLAKRSFNALKLGKNGFYRSLSMTDEEAVDYSAKMIGVISSAEDAFEGRAPLWRKGHLGGKAGKKPKVVGLGMGSVMQPGV